MNVRPVSLQDIDEIAVQGDPVSQQRGSQECLSLYPIIRNIRIPQDEALGITAQSCPCFREDLSNNRHATLEQITFEFAIRRAAA
ncbi:hypothetical protein AA102526_2399 [Asaia lannensis NBRC 102526]|nr:hypothetical protein AA102526_2399 [Asaia lannensis NBRC 102526]